MNNSVINHKLYIVERNHRIKNNYLKRHYYRYIDADVVKLVNAERVDVYVFKDGFRLTKCTFPTDHSKDYATLVQLGSDGPARAYVTKHSIDCRILTDRLYQVETANDFLDVINDFFV